MSTAPLTSSLCILLFPLALGLVHRRDNGVSWKKPQILDYLVHRSKHRTRSSFRSTSMPHDPRFQVGNHDQSYLEWLRQSDIVSQAAAAMGMPQNTAQNLEREELESLIREYVHKRRNVVPDRKALLAQAENIQSLISKISRVQNNKVPLSTFEAAEALGNIMVSPPSSLSLEPSQVSQIFTSLKDAYEYKPVKQLGRTELRSEWDFVSLSALKSLGSLGASHKEYSRMVLIIMTTAWPWIKYYTKFEGYITDGESSGGGRRVYDSVMAEKSRTAVEAIGNIGLRHSEFSGAALDQLRLAYISNDYPAAVRLEAIHSLRKLRWKFWPFTRNFLAVSTLLLRARFELKRLREKSTSEIFQNMQSESMINVFSYCKPESLDVYDNSHQHAHEKRNKWNQLLSMRSLIAIITGSVATIVLFAISNSSISVSPATLIGRLG